MRRFIENMKMIVAVNNQDPSNANEQQGNDFLSQAASAMQNEQYNIRKSRAESGKLINQNEEESKHEMEFDN